MPPQKGANPFELAGASTTSQISPSPARTSVKSHGSQGRLSVGGGRAGGRSVSFAGGAKAGAAEEVPVNAAALKEIHQERVSWQATQTQRFLELPQVNPQLHQSLNSIYPVVRDQTIFLSEQFRDLDQMLENK